MKILLNSNSVHALVKPHADAIRSCAAAMEAAGMGLDEKRGHVKVLRNMADSIESESHLGKLPYVYHDENWISAAAVPRKALHPNVQRLCAKAEISGPLPVYEIDKKIAGLGLDAQARMALKLSLSQAGLVLV